MFYNFNGRNYRYKGHNEVLSTESVSGGRTKYYVLTKNGVKVVIL